MGRGHSGSTVLDALLGNGFDVHSVGELVSGVGNYVEEICSCGAQLTECSFWIRVRALFEQRSDTGWDKAARLSLSQANVKNFVASLTASRNSNWVKELLQITKDMLAAISEVSGKNTLVDSSKEHTRGLFLMRFLPNSKIIHLVRNQEGVLSSYYYRMRQGGPFKFLRVNYYPKRLTFIALGLVCVSWVVGNFLAEAVRMYDKSRFMRIRYEDLCSDPRRELERIENFIGCDLQSVIESIESNLAMQVGHNIGGNEMRFQTNFVFDPNARIRRFLPWPYKIMARIISWPLMLYYGYNPFGGLEVRK